MSAGAGMKHRARHGSLAWGRSAAWAALWLCVLLAPWLGKLHALAHPPGHWTAHLVHRVHSEAAPAPAGWTAAFGVHGSAADCLLFDQLAQADALPGLPPVLPVATPQPGPTLALAPPVFLVWPALFQARAPPQTPA